MSKNIKLKDLFLGKTDAKHELIENSTRERARFLQSFLIPENIVLDNFLIGSKYFITGLKGTGKTALLRYLALVSENDYKAQTSFVLFKSEFTEDDRKDFSRAANTTIIDKDVLPNEFDGDFTAIWHWFLHREIVSIITKTSNNIFNKDTSWDRYEKCVNAPKIGDDTSGIKKYFPKLTKGNVEIEAGINTIKGKLGLDFEWIDTDKTKVKFSSIVKQADQLFKKLNPGKGKLIVFIDELELTLGKTKQYDRDVRLIRDLIFAVSNINTIAKQNNVDLRVICAIRSEVITSIQSSGKELNKIITDYGTTINWHQSGGAAKDHPLLRIIFKKIATSEQENGITPYSSDDEIWAKYFTEMINSKNTYEYILHQTWFRPRDIVRLLTAAQEQFPYAEKFTHQVFDAIRKEYSKQSWVEHAEELRTKFTERQIEGIKQLLNGVKSQFTYHEISSIADMRREMYDELDELLEKNKLASVLGLLYSTGILGNGGERVRFAFRGDDELLIDKPIKVHDALYNFFAIEKHS